MPDSNPAPAHSTSPLPTPSTSSYSVARQPPPPLPSCTRRSHPSATRHQPTDSRFGSRSNSDQDSTPKACHQHPSATTTAIIISQPASHSTHPHLLTTRPLPRLLDTKRNREMNPSCGDKTQPPRRTTTHSIITSVAMPCHATPRRYARISHTPKKCPKKKM